MASCTSILRNCLSCIARKELTVSDATDAQVRKIACVALSIFTAVAGTFLLGLAISGTFPAGCLRVGILLLSTALGSGFYGANIKDCDDPKEVLQMRDKALGQDYRALVSEHGAGPDVVKYSVPSAEAFIVRKGILPAEAVEVKREIHHEKNRYADQLAALNRQYPQRRERILSEYKKEEQRIHQQAHDDQQMVYLRKSSPWQDILELENIEKRKEAGLKGAWGRFDEGIRNPNSEKQQKEYDQAFAHLSRDHAEKAAALQARLQALGQEELRSQ